MHNRPISTLANFSPVFADSIDSVQIEKLCAEYPYGQFPLLIDGRLVGVRLRIFASFCVRASSFDASTSDIESVTNPFWLKNVCSPSSSLDRSRADVFPSASAVIESSPELAELTASSGRISFMELTRCTGTNRGNFPIVRVSAGSTILRSIEGSNIATLSTFSKTFVN